MRSEIVTRVATSGLFPLLLSPQTTIHKTATRILLLFFCSNLFHITKKTQGKGKIKFLPGGKMSRKSQALFSHLNTGIIPSFERVQSNNIVDQTDFFFCSFITRTKYGINMTGIQSVSLASFFPYTSRTRLSGMGEKKLSRSHEQKSSRIFIAV